MSNGDLEKVRIDRWLWAVRVFKTRAAAAEACKGGKVEVGGEKVKPSRSVKVGELVLVSKEGVERTYRVVGLLLKRVGAKAAVDYAEDLTPPELLQERRLTVAQRVLQRDSGTGRPTKRDRREIERLFGD